MENALRRGLRRGLMGWRLRWREGKSRAGPYINAHTHLPFSALHPQLPTLLIKLALAIVQLPAAISNWRRRSSYCLRRSSLTSRSSRRRANLHSLAHGQGYKRRNRLLNIANGVVDNIGLGRNGDSVSRVNKRNSGKRFISQPQKKLYPH